MKGTLIPSAEQSSFVRVTDRERPLLNLFSLQPVGTFREHGVGPARTHGAPGSNTRAHTLPFSPLLSFDFLFLCSSTVKLLGRVYPLSSLTQLHASESPHSTLQMTPQATGHLTMAVKSCSMCPLPLYSSEFSVFIEFTNSIPYISLRIPAFIVFVFLFMYSENFCHLWWTNPSRKPPVE